MRSAFGILLLGLLATAPVAGQDGAALQRGDRVVFTALESCRDESGKFRPATVIESSGLAHIDQRALRLSKSRAYRPKDEDADERGCVRFRINFVVDANDRIVDPRRDSGRHAIDIGEPGDLPPNARE